MTTCVICGLSAYRHITNKGRCLQMQALKNEYPDFLKAQHDREQAKREGWATVHNDGLALEARVEGGKKVLFSWFCRSMFLSLNLIYEHPNFESYAAMLLNQPHTQGLFPEAVLNALVKVFGQAPGIPNGRSNYRPVRHQSARVGLLGNITPLKSERSE